MDIVVTNDDGIDSAGLHALVVALSEHGSVTVIAPEDEHSGASASLGDLSRRPQARRALVPGADESWAVNGPPALCAALVINGVFGELPHLLVAGVNAGVNVGWSFIHSGTVGAARTAHQGGVPSMAVSQAVEGWHFDQQGQMDLVGSMAWDAAAQVAGAVVAGWPTGESGRSAPLVNLNIPRGATVADFAGWRRTRVGSVPASSRAGSHEPVPGRVDRVRALMKWGDRDTPEPGSDAAAIADSAVSVTWLGGHPVLLEALEVPSSVSESLDSLVGPAS